MSLNFKHLLAGVLLLMSTQCLLAQDSPRKAFFKSAIVPGWGELSNGRSSGYLFLVNEIVLWSGYWYMGQKKDQYEDRAWAFAREHAGVSDTYHNTDYMDLIGRYNSSGFDAGGYNEQLLMTAQAEDPAAVVQDNIYLHDASWQWASSHQRKQYRTIRKNASLCDDNLKAFTGAIIANHLASAINSGLRARHRLHLNTNVVPGGTSQLGLSYEF